MESHGMVSFLADLINSQAYSEGNGIDENFQAFSKAVNELDENFADAKKQSVWKVLDTSWN